MNGRSLVIHPAHPRSAYRRRPRQRYYRRTASRISNFITIVAAALFLGSLSFAAVAVDWPKLLNGSEVMNFSWPKMQSSGEAMTLSNAKAVALQLSGKSKRPIDPIDVIESKASTMASLEIEEGRATAKLAEAKIRLEPPDGHCFLDPKHPGDAHIYSVFERIFRGDIRMLNGYAECVQLKMWRIGGRTTLDDYGNVLIPVAVINRTVDGPTGPYVQEVCQTMRQNAGVFRGRNMPGLKNMFEKALEKSPVNAMRLLGVVDQDQHACYFVLLQKIMTEKRETKTQVDVAAVTFLGGKMVFINLYGELKSDGTLMELLQRQKANVARNVALNRG